jgi:hypothetical protein
VTLLVVSHVSALTSPPVPSEVKKTGSTTQGSFMQSGAEPGSVGELLRFGQAEAQRLTLENVADFENESSTP